MKSIVVFLYFIILISGLANSQTLCWDWVDVAEGQGFENSTALLKANNKLYHAGTFEGNITIGGTIYTASGAKDAFLCIYDSSNVLEKTLIFTGDGTERISNILSDINGNLFLMGTMTDTMFLDTMSFIPSTITSMFIICLNDNDSVVGYKTNGGEPTAKCTATAATWNKQGTGILISGYLSNGYNIFNDDTIYNSNLYITSYNPVINQFNWVKAVESYGGSITPTDIEITDTGAVYVSGTFNLDIYIDIGWNINSFGNLDGFLLKTDSTGNVIWCVNVGGPQNDAITGIELDDNENIVLCGRFSKTAYFLNDEYLLIADSVTSYQIPEMNDMFIAKYSPDGNLMHAKSFGGNNHDGANCMDKDENGLFYVSGSITEAYQDSVWFDSVGVIPYGGQAPFIAVLDSALNVVNVIYSQYSQHTNGSNIFVESDTSVYLSGEYCGNTTFSDIILSNNDVCDWTYTKNLFVSHLNKADVSAQIKGTVYLSGNPVMAKVTFFQKDSSNARFIINKWTDTQGRYTFNTNSKGQYFIRGEITSSCPTYYVQEYLWDHAAILNVSSDTVINNVDIHILTNSTLSGSNSISGTTFNQDTTAIGFVRLILADTNNVFVATQLSDTLGFYQFDHVPSGTYKLLADTAGLTLASYYTITVGSKNLYYDYDFIFCFDSMICALNPTNLIDADQRLEYSVFPNPTTSTFFLYTPGKTPENIKIFSIDGSMVPVETSQTGSYCTIKLSVSCTGIYLLKFRSDDCEYIKRIVILNDNY